MKAGQSHYLFGSKRRAKLQRLKAKGMLPTNAELQQLCKQATAQHPITSCPAGKPPETTRGHKYDRSGHILRG